MCWFPNLRYANYGSIIVYLQTTFPQILSPWLQLFTVNLKRSLVCEVAKYSGRPHADGTPVHAEDNIFIPPSAQWTWSWICTSPGISISVKAPDNLDKASAL